MNKKKTSDKLALRIARAKLQAIRSVMQGSMDKMTANAFNLKSHVDFGPPKFIQAWAVNRGYTGITQALDSEGIIWERVTQGHKVQNVWITDASWWVPLSMERREAKPDGEPIDFAKEPQP
jgi:hypothetical protein